MAVGSGPRRATMLLVAGCFFLENLDATIVTTAAPAIGVSLGVRATSVGLVVTAFLLSVAVLVPVGGWLARRAGARVVFTAAIAVFVAASAGCAAAQDLPELIALRVVQGAGAALMVPVGRLVVLADARREDLLRVVAWISWPGLLAPVVAPLVGGLIVSSASWRWIFLINVPLGAVALVASLVLVRDLPRADSPPLDVPGAVLLGGALAGLAWTAHLVADTSTGAVRTGCWAGASVLLTVAAVRHLVRTRHPLVDLRALARVRTLRAGVSATALVWLVIGAVPFLLPLLFQEVFGWDPVRSGAVVLLVFAGNVGIKPATTPLLRRFGFRSTLLVALWGSAVTVAAFAGVSASTPLVLLGVLCVASGVARSVGFTSLNSLAMADVEPSDVPTANTLMLTAQQVCAGLAVAGATMELRAGRAVTSAGGAVGDALRAVAGLHRAPYALAFVALAVPALAAAAVVGRLPRDAGDAVTGTRPRLRR